MNLSFLWESLQNTYSGTLTIYSYYIAFRSDLPEWRWLVLIAVPREMQVSKDSGYYDQSLFSCSAGWQEIYESERLKMSIKIRLLIENVKN